MSWFSNILSSGVDRVVGATMEGLDNLFTSDDERNKAKIILEKQMQEFKLKMVENSNEFEKEITKRWESDNEHIITRLVRPISYTGVLILFGAVVIADGNVGAFHVNSSYIPVLETLLTTMTIAYFGSRGMEKVTKQIKDRK